MEKCDTSIQNTMVGLLTVTIIVVIMISMHRCIVPHRLLPWTWVDAQQEAVARAQTQMATSVSVLVSIVVGRTVVIEITSGVAACQHG